MSKSDKKELYFRRVAGLLVAGDVDARFEENSAGPMIRVKLVDGTLVMWGIYEDLWSYTALDRDGDMVETGTLADVPQDSPAEEVARAIAMFDYHVDESPHKPWPEIKAQRMEDYVQEVQAEIPPMQSCVYCHDEFPYPVELHHDDEECMQTQKGSPEYQDAFMRRRAAAAESMD